MSRDGTVYLVDRDEAVRNRLTRLFASAGYVVAGYASVEAFLAEFPAKGMACIVLDSDTVDLSRPDSRKALEGRGASHPVLFITSHNDAEARRRARAFGAEGYYEKPVDSAALVDAIEWALDSHELDI